MPELHDYVNADVRLDPKHDDLPWDRFQEVKDKVIEDRVHRTNNAKLHYGSISRIETLSWLKWLPLSAKRRS
jgi:hypothetical protein